jgi:hypothetical protein
MPPVTFRFALDAYSPETIPMERFALYLLEVARLMGETQQVHFSKLEGGSTRAFAVSDWEAAPKIRKRLSEVRVGEGPNEPRLARRRIDEMLVEDNASGELSEMIEQKPHRLIYFRGAKRSVDVDYGPFREPGSLDGVPIVIGGETDMVPVHLQDRDHVHVCRASRPLAKQIATHLFQTPIRVDGIGTWFRSRDGEWEMRRFTIHGFRTLRQESVADVASRLQKIPSRLQASDDPVGELVAMMRSAGEKR